MCSDRRFVLHRKGVKEKERLELVPVLISKKTVIDVSLIVF